MTIAPEKVERYLRTGGRDPALAERIESLRRDALKVVRPARVWRRFDRRDPSVAGRDGLGIDASRTLSLHLDGCHAVYLVCGTIGAAFDAFQRKAAVRSAADAFVLQAIGAAAIEEWMDQSMADIRLELEAGETLVNRYSPGFGDFPLAAQRQLLSLVDAPRRAGVSLTDTLLMVPSKSVSAVVGVRRAAPPDQQETRR